MTVTHENESFLLKLRTIFWPVENHELKKFMPMVLMMFFFLFNYTIMRDTKDTLVVTEAGAAVIPFLKLWGTLPMSVVFVIVYSKLSNILKTTTLFYTIVTPFLCYFVLFGFVIYPNINYLKTDSISDGLQAFVSNNLPQRTHDTLYKLIEMVRVWPYAIFYIAAELWGSMGISLLFWQFANHITRPNEAKRFYGGFAQLGNLALVCSGLVIIYFSGIRSRVPTNVDAWGITLKWLMMAIAFGCAVIIFSYQWMNKYVVTDPVLCDVDRLGTKTTLKKKKKGSLLESFKFLASSKYLGCIAILVVSYGVSINLIEVVWKHALKEQFPNPNDYNEFMGYFSMSTGLFTLFLITIGSNIIRHFGWKVAALAAPIVLVITGGMFFLFVHFQHSFESGLFGYSALWIAVLAGAAQNVLSKATKYSLFDPTKEMSYIPLDTDSKIKGKAAIDVVGSRLGKSGGSLVLQVVFLLGPISQNLPVVFLMVTLVVALWIRSVFALSKLYNEKLAHHEKLKESQPVVQ